MKLEFSRRIFEKYSNKKFHKNSSSGNRVVPYGQTDTQTDGQTVKTKIMVAFRNFANAHKNRLSASYVGTLTSGVWEWGDLLSAKDMGWWLQVESATRLPRYMHDGQTDGRTEHGNPLGYQIRGGALWPDSWSSQLKDHRPLNERIGQVTLQIIIL
jgi:hypothetical protein